MGAASANHSHRSFVAPPVHLPKIYLKLTRARTKKKTTDTCESSRILPKKKGNKKHCRTVSTNDATDAAVTRNQHETNQTINTAVRIGHWTIFSSCPKFVIFRLSFFPRNSDPGSHSLLPPTHYASRRHFCRENTSALYSLVNLRRIYVAL